MANLRKCDICGEFIDPINHVFMVAWISTRGTDRIEDWRTHFDFCPDCKDKIQGEEVVRLLTMPEIEEFCKKYRGKKNGDR